MLYSLLADAVLLLHFAFILFVVLGGLLLHRFPRMIWAHVPAVAWGVLIEFAGWICPLTPLENHLRRLGGAAGYSGSFVEHYLLPMIYPDSLTRETQWILGLGVVVANAIIYAFWLRAAHRPPSP